MSYPIPQWQLEPGGLWVTFHFSEEHVQLISEQGEATGESDVGVNVGVNVGVKEVLEFVRENQPVNASTIAAHYPHVTQRTIERWLKSLREQGKIEFRGAPKTGGYFTTENSTC